MEISTLLKRVKSFFIENENVDEYKDDVTGITFYQDYINGILIKTDEDYQKDDTYFMLYSDIYGNKEA